MIKYTIHDTNFQVDINTGELFIETEHGNILVIENSLAIELIEILRQKLYLHKDQKDGILKRFFK
jgi:hypothetical protein